jgi:hypothetical protein
MKMEALRRLFVLHLCRWREVAVEGKRREMERNLEIVFSATVIYIYA